MKGQQPARRPQEQGPTAATEQEPGGWAAFQAKFGNAFLGSLLMSRQPEPALEGPQTPADGGFSSAPEPWETPVGPASPVIPDAAELREGSSERATGLLRSSRSEELVRHQTTPGEGSKELGQVMGRLQQAPAEQEAGLDLERLALLRGDDSVAPMQDDYRAFLAHRAASDAPEAVDEARHPGFLGSPEQLAYGRVSGEITGLDPVFSALLNPTGGLVGPGNDATLRGRGECVGAHGIVHDAAGYGYNHGFGGPGYDYLGAEVPALTGNPLSGQWSGTQHWCGADGERRADEAGSAVADIAAGFGEKANAAQQRLNPFSGVVNHLDRRAKATAPRAEREAGNARGFTDVLGDQVYDSFEATRMGAEFLGASPDLAAPLGVAAGAAEMLFGIPRAAHTVYQSSKAGHEER